MNTFECALVSLCFRDVEVNRENSSDNNNQVGVKNDSEKVTVTKGFINLEIFKSNGNLPGVLTRKTYELKGTFNRASKAIKADASAMYWVGNVVQVSDSYPLFAIMPYVSMLVAQGWEIIETKTNPWPAYAQALLKRKVTTKKK